MLGDEWNPDAGVGLNDVEDNLCTNVLQQVLYVVADERIIIDCAPALKVMSICDICCCLMQS